MNDNRVRRIIIYALIGVVALWAVIIGTVLVVQAGRGPSPTPTATAVAPSPTVTQTPSPVPTASPTMEPTGTPTPELSPTPPPTVTPVPETATPTPAASETPSKTGLEIDRGDPNSSMIALTFDAGASSEPTPKILDTLKERGLKVTMFLTGKWIEENPELVKRIQADGHEIGNHTYSHPDLTKISDREITSELAQVEKLVKQRTGQSTKPWFRPPYGARNQHVLNVAADAGYTSIYWTIDSLDWETDRSPASVLDRVTKPVDSDGRSIPLNGAIVLEHLGSPQTAEVLPQILDRLEAKGLRVVTVSELLTP